MLEGSATEICKGDKIRVIKGDLSGINGKVMQIDSEGGFIYFVPTNFEGFNDELKLEASQVVKYFEPGDEVRVIDGKYKGESGIVVSAETDEAGVAKANVSLGQSRKEIKIFTNNLKFKSEIDQSGSG